MSAAQLVQCRSQLFQMLRSILFALQKSFDVSRYLLPLPGEVLAFDKFLRGRNQVSSRPLRNIHASVRYADDVLDREAVHGETGHPEASRDAVLTEHRIGGQP